MGDAALLPRLFAAQAAVRGDAIAIRDRGDTLTYRALAARANRLAAYLRAAGVGPECLVGVALDRSVDLVVSLLAVLKAGGAYLPLDPAYPVRRLKSIVELARPSVIVTDEAARARLPDGGGAVVSLDGDADRIGDCPDAEPQVALSPENLAYVIYTSGSTGTPKGVAVSHASVAALLEECRQLYPFTADDRWTLFHSYAFDFSVWEIFGALSSGAELAVVPLDVARDPEVFLDFLAASKTTVLNQTPSAFHGLVDAAERRGWTGKDTALRFVILGGEAVDPRRIAAWLADERPWVVNMYGITEVTVHGTFRRLRRDDAQGDGSPIGDVLPARLGYVVDELVEPAPEGNPGELALGGAALARGYLDAPGLTAARFVPNPFAGDGSRLYLSGDGVRLVRTGELDFLGRLDDQVKVRGFRIEPAEIEAVLREHPGVRDAVVVARDEGRGTRLVAYVVGPPDAVPALRDAVAERLPAFMVPAAFVPLASLPLTPNGKLDRAALPAPPSPGGTEREAPETAEEALVAGVWADVLGLELVGVDENFFDLGGDSLLASQIVVRCAERGVEIRVRDVFEHQTVAGVAAHARRAGAPEPPSAQPETEELPLTPLQEAVLYESEAGDDPALYVLQFTAELERDLDVGRLREAWSVLAERHDALRTGIEWRGRERPVQVVRAQVDMPLTELDWMALAGDDAVERELETLLAHERARGFDLPSPPLLRMHVASVGSRRHVLVVTAHHVVVDGWSMSVLVEELFALHDGKDPDGDALPEPGSYRDYGAWLARRDAERAAAFWAEELAGVDEATRVPGPVPAGEGCGRVVARLEPELVEAVGELARAERLTVNSVMQGAFAVLLGRWARSDDVVFGTAVSGRWCPVPRIDRVVGLCIDAIPSRVPLPPETPVLDVLCDLQERQLEAQAHAGTPLVEIRAAGDLAPGAPVFECLFAFDNYVISGDGVRRADTWNESRFPLVFALTKKDGLELSVYYRRDRLDAPQVEALGRWYLELLAAITATPHARIADLGARSSLPVVTRDEARYEPPLQLFARTAAANASAPAVVCGDAQLSYAELDRRSAEIAGRLRAAGVGAESVVALALARSPEFVCSLLGTWRAGAAFLPLDPADPVERLRGMVAAVGAAVVLTDASHEQLAASLPAPVLHADGTSLAGGDAVDLPDEPPAGLAYVIFTSGSTGEPKGVAVSRRGLGALVRAQADAFGLAPGTRVLQLAPPAFDAAVAEIVTTLLSGATLVLPPEGDRLTEAWRLLEQGAADVVTVPPSLLAAAGPERLGGLRTVVVAGEACPSELAAAWPEGPRLVNAYGPTEATVCATLQLVDPSEVRDVVPIGAPLPGTTAYVVDADLSPVPPRLPGELLIGGVGLARGYLGRPGSTAERFVPDPFAGDGSRLYRSGDRVRRREDGALEFLGRLDDQVKVRGFRVEPAEVEAALRSHPAVRDAAVVARDGSLHAFVAAPAGLEDELRAELARRLPSFMLPSALVALPSLPLRANGKVDRAALRAPKPPPRPAVREPTPLERDLAAIWEKLLGVADVGPEDDFLELGGHSLLAMRLVSRVQERLGLELPLAAALEQTRLADLAAVLERADGAEPSFVRTGGGDVVPVSFGQRRLWFLDRLVPGSSAYSVPAAVRLRGRLDVEALERALCGVVARHEVLRSVLVERAGEPLARVGAPPARVLRRVDLSGLSGRERDLELRRRLVEEASRPFELARGPLLRGVLVRLGAEEHVLAVTVHHLACDGWSVGVLVDELARLYRGEPVEPLPVQYGDFALWQRRLVEGERCARQLAYWRERLADCPVLELPRPRAAAASASGVVAAVLPARLVAGVERLSREHGATLFMTLLAAFQLVLSRFADQEEVTVGTPVAGRGRPEFERLVGFFVNTLVLRGDLSGDPLVSGLLARTRERALEAYANQDVPFDRLVEELNPNRAAAHTPLFQAALTIEDAYAAPPAPWPDELSVEPVDVDTVSSEHDLHLFVRGIEGGALETRLAHSAEVEGGLAERLAAAWVSVLEQFVAAPGARLSELSVLAAADRARLLGRWNQTAVPVPEATVSELYEAQVARSPEAVAVRCGSEELSYRQLEERANRLAGHLRGLGVGPESLVGVCLERSPELVVVLLAVLKAGGAYLPLDPDYPAERLAFMLADSGARLVATDSRLAALLPDRLPSVLLDRLEGAASAADLPAASPANLAYVIYTSGTTGVPKGVAVTHRGIASLVRAQSGAFGIRGRVRVLQLAPLSFDASVAEILVTLLAGGTLVLLPGGERVAAAWRALRSGEVDVVTVPPALLEGVEPAPALRTLVVAGEACPVETAAAWSQACRLVNAYGPTETTVCATLHVATAEVREALPIGRPIANTTAYVVDRDGNLVAPGVPGELLIGGAGLARGYLGRPGSTAERFVPNPFAGDGSRLYRSGDRVRRREEGAIEFLGRLDDQVKVRGYRVEPAEVETAIRRHPDVTAAAVVLRTLPATGEALVAYVTGPRIVSPAGLRAFLAERLPAHMLPAVCVQLASLPLLPSGKVDRASLPLPDATGGGRAAPRNPVEQLVHDLWVELLGAEQIGVQDDFFQLGGQSLVAARFIARVRELLDVELPFTALFDAPVLEDVAATIAAACLAQPEEVLAQS